MIKYVKELVQSPDEVPETNPENADVPTVQPIELPHKCAHAIPLKSEVLLGHLGLEPRTIRLKAEYSTIELVTLESMR